MNKIFTILIITFLLLSCEKEEGCIDPLATNYNHDATVDNGSCNYAQLSDLNIHFTHTVNGNQLILNSMMYTNAANENYSVQTVRYLISNITLHTDDGSSTILDNMHYVDISIDSTTTLKITEITDLNYSSISFTVGLDSANNKTNLFLNESFFPSFAWPEILGGGYHYMQLEGDFNTLFQGYATHTGGTDGIDYSFEKKFPLSPRLQNENTISINMEINNWYSNPNIINLSDAIMANSSIQAQLKINGETDVFSLNIIE